MIDEVSPNGIGWARFSGDRLHRYRLSRALTERGRTMHDRARVVFVMFNPSTADAFKPDNTITKCVQFARRWGADSVEAVNLFSFRTPHPKELKAAADHGGDPTNNAAILEACRGATKVIAAWGAGGGFLGRGDVVKQLIQESGIQLLHLGLSRDGFPKHPLARGKNFIPLDREPTPWTCL